MLDLSVFSSYIEGGVVEYGTSFYFLHQEKTLAYQLVLPV
jgi:hypothetical protein